MINDVRQAHDEWQIDAKEQVKLEAAGQAKLEPREEACYLNITDTKSHALLNARAFPTG
ncbi:MAG: hypothetical protein H6559_02085 [Lewinellaceae bacterium]|nr:hypothetical protein [Lewinellaceae bacterium]